MKNNYFIVFIEKLLKSFNYVYVMGSSQWGLK